MTGWKFLVTGYGPALVSAENRVRIRLQRTSRGTRVAIVTSAKKEPRPSPRLLRTLARRQLHWTLLRDQHGLCAACRCPLQYSKLVSFTFCNPRAPTAPDFLRDSLVLHLPCVRRVQPWAAA
jgi:hypothetical protein